MSFRSLAFAILTVCACAPAEEQPTVVAPTLPQPDPEPTTTTTSTTSAPVQNSGVSMSAGKIEADGIVLTDLSCSDVQGGGMGLFGMLGLAGGFTSRKAQLDACGAKASTRVEWTGAGGRMTRVKASSGNAASDRCVERALSNAPATVEAACSATLHR